MLSPTQQSCAHRGEFFTVIALATPATFDVEDDEFHWMWKEGFTHEVVVCSRVKGTLRIALRNAARRAEYDRLDIYELVKIRPRLFDATRDLSSRGDKIVS